MLVNQILVILITLLGLVRSQIIQLGGEIFFYELSLQRPKDVRVRNNVDFQQSFAFTVVGQGKCALQKSTHIESGDSSKKSVSIIDLSLSSNVQLYSDQEQTLSFLTKIQFVAKKNTEKNPLKNNDFSGFEIVFHQNNSQINCVQIIPSMNKHIEIENAIFTFGIKDLPMVTQTSPKYLYYFGKASVRPLKVCGNTDSGVVDRSGRPLCYSQETQLVEMGVESGTPNVPVPMYQPDLCPEPSRNWELRSWEMKKDTCIMRHSDTYYIVVSTATDQFETQLADIDIYRVNEETNKLFENAREANTSAVQIHGVDWPLENYFNPNVAKMVPHIAFHNRQADQFGRIIKLVNTKQNTITYMSQLYNPTKKNKCVQNESVPMCYCGANTANPCRPCYRLDDKTHNPYRFVDKIDFNPPDNSSDRQNNCLGQHFKAFDFKKYSIATTFQNNYISSPLKHINPNSTSDFTNRNYLPTLCASTTFRNNFFTVAIILNDYSKIGFISQTRFELNVFVLTLQEESEELKVEKLGAFQLKDSSHEIMIDNLLEGAYLIELIPKPNYTYCSRGECLDESPGPNRYQCVKCNKLVTVLVLKKHADRSQSDEELRIDSYNWTLSSPPLSFSKICPDSKSSANVYVRQADLNFHSERNYVCSSIQSVEERTSTIQTGNYTGWKYSLTTEIFSRIVPSSFNPVEIVLPYEFVVQNEAQLDGYCNFNQKDDDPFIQLYITICFFLFLIALIALISIMSHLNEKTKRVFFLPNTKITFYISMFINGHDQAELKNLVEKFTNKLKKKFYATDFCVLDFTTADGNAKFIEQSDMVFYVLGCEGELDYFSPNFDLVGQNSFHFDLFKLINKKLIGKLHFIEFSPEEEYSKEKQALDFIDGGQPLIRKSRLKIPQDLSTMLEIIKPDLAVNTENKSCWKWLLGNDYVIARGRKELKYSIKSMYASFLRSNTHAFGYKTIDFGAQPVDEAAYKFV